MKHGLPSLVGFCFFLPLALAAAEFDPAVAINQTGLDLYRHLAARRPAQNLIVSPYSIESALTLAYAGAQGVTREELSSALHFPADEAAVHEAFAALRSSLATISAASLSLARNRTRDPSHVHTVIDGRTVELPGEPEPVVGIEWHEANQLFAQSDSGFRDSFVSLLRDYYAASLAPLDFRREPESARHAINHWVEEKTLGKIPDLIPSGGVGPATRLVLVNALYFKAPWDSPFEKELTQPQSFHLSVGTAHDVPTMLRGGSLGYVHEPGFSVVALDYLGRDLRCLILLPDENQSVEAVAGKLTPADFTRWTKLGREVEPTRLVLHLPRFRVEGNTFPLGAALRQLGVKSAFDEPPNSANFDRIAPRNPTNYLKLSEVFHQTFLALDEEGTEAAAATAVSMSLAGSRMPTTPPVEVRVDRPFLIAIQHRASGACLFLGRIVDPR